MNEESLPPLYLSGIMDGATEHEQHGWREEVKRKWSGHCFDPTRRNLDIETEYRDIVEADLKDIAKSDVLLLNSWCSGRGIRLMAFWREAE